MIWLANGDTLPETALSAITQAGLGGGIFVSIASAWEIGMLSRIRPGRAGGMQFLPDPKTWFTRFLAGPGIKPAEITAQIAIDASFLPGELHGDPADRLIIATARHLGATIVTRDQRIISYAEGGYATVIAC